MGKGGREASLTDGVIFTGVKDHAPEGRTDEGGLRRG